MFEFLKNLFSPVKSDFVLDQINHLRRIVIVEDKELSLRIEIPFADKPLKQATIVGPYDILLTYKDGSQQKKKILN